MRRLTTVVFAQAMLLSATHGLFAGEPATEVLLRLTVSLKDGSRLIGEPSLNALPVQSASMGKLSIPLEKVRALNFSADHEFVTVVLQNGDQVRGALELASLSLKTLFGVVTVPLEAATEIQVRSGGNRGKDGLVLYFNFDVDHGDRVPDDTANGNDGAVHGARFTPQGKRGGAYEFDGRGNYIKVPRSDSLNLRDEVSILFWMKPAEGNTDCRGLVTTDFYLVELSPCHEPGIMFAVSTDGGATFKHSFDVAGRAVAFTPGRWQHVAATYDGKTARLYVDGTLELQRPHEGKLSLMGGQSFLAIGSEDGRQTCPGCIGTRYFRGLLDEVKIFNRALTADEIAAEYDEAR